MQDSEKGKYRRFDSSGEVCTCGLHQLVTSQSRGTLNPPRDQIRSQQPRHSPISNENENMTNEDLWNASKTVLRENFIARSAYVKKDKPSQIDYVNWDLSNYGR